MKVSIITVAYNADKYILDTISSVKNQTYKNIEYIIVDGGSSDNTLEIIKSNLDFINIYISESDNGLYDAMNKGLRLAKGDIIGFLNSDDVFFDNNVVENIVANFDKNTDSIFADVVFVENDNLNRITRYYSGENFKVEHFKFGHMPPHPSFYARRDVYLKVGDFKLNYKISADFDYLLRALFIHKTKFKYYKYPLVKMRSGGVSSTIKNKFLLNREILRSFNENNLKTNYLNIYSKYIFKIFSFLFR